MSETFKQEMPPVGGYRPLNFERTFAKKFLTFTKCMVITSVWPLIALYFWRKEKQWRFMIKIEENNHNIPLQPCMLAERDREYLRQIRRNRDEEADLMKNVKGWEVGKLYDQRVLKTTPPDMVRDDLLSEYYVHTRYYFLKEFFLFDLTR